MSRIVAQTDLVAIGIEIGMFEYGGTPDSQPTIITYSSVISESRGGPEADRRSFLIGADSCWVGPCLTV